MNGRRSRMDARQAAGSMRDGATGAGTGAGSGRAFLRPPLAQQVRQWFGQQVFIEGYDDNLSFQQRAKFYSGPVHVQRCRARLLVLTLDAELPHRIVVRCTSGGSGWALIEAALAQEFVSGDEEPFAALMELVAEMAQD